MVTPRLKSLSVTDFRSIRGEVRIPLDAQVVLLHGVNGAGKTSVVSALELAVTGEIPSMRRADSGFRNHLVHRGQQSAIISLAVDGFGNSATTELEVGPNGTISKGSPLLADSEAQFFSERCLLAQATLARLLEIYQGAGADGGDSALTRYVRDLLGLDQIDALIEGLHASRHVARIRHLVPEYASAETELRRLDARRKDVRERVGLLEGLQRERADEARSLLLDLGVEWVEPGTEPSPDRLIDEALPDDEDWLGFLFDTRTEVRALVARTVELDQSANLEEIEAAEQSLSSAQTEIGRWERNEGAQLTRLLDELGGTVAGLSRDIRDPVRAVDGALERVETSLALARADSERISTLTHERTELVSHIEALEERQRLIHAQVAEVTPDVDQWTRLFAEIATRLDSQVCPVCDRDFADTHSGDLRDHVSQKLSRLTQDSQRLSELSALRTQLDQELRRAQRRRDEVGNEVSALPAQSPEQVFRLAEAAAALREMRATSVLVSEAINRMTESQAKLSQERLRSSFGQEMTAAQDRIRERILGRGGRDVGAIGLRELDAWLKDEIEECEKRRRMRGGAEKAVKSLASVTAELSELRRRLDEVSERRREVQQCLDAANSIRESAKSLHHNAEAARDTVIRSVFNQSLNAVWRDLFLRLAPGEPFIPRFEVPASQGAVDAVLKTVHRDGTSAGNPGAMLSSGNLNTAALTLFLSLHLQIAPRLPWLVLDDPVQSMDDVHISHLAALLRTLSREHGRQIVIAVHERPLFEYLRLELWPAFQGDSLVTAEISRFDDAATSVEAQHFGFEPDTALAS